MDINKQYEQEFTRPIIKYGRFINLLCVFLCFIPSLLLWFVYDAKPSWSDIAQGWGLIASIFLVYAVIEPVSYFPILGLPGTYLGVLSGNIGNVRVPASAVSQEAVGVEPGTKKAELVSTIAISGSIITNLLIVTIGAIGGATLISIFPPIVREAFTYVSPAIFGAMFGMNAVKNLKYGIFAAILVSILLGFTTLGAYIVVPVAVFGTVAFGFIEHKMKNDK